MVRATRHFSILPRKVGPGCPLFAFWAGYAGTEPKKRQPIVASASTGRADHRRRKDGVDRRRVLARAQRLDFALVHRQARWGEPGRLRNDISRGRHSSGRGGDHRSAVSPRGVQPRIEPTAQAAGKRVRLKTYAPLGEPPRRNFMGVVKGVAEDAVMLEVSGIGDFRIPFGEIAKANLEFDF